MSSVEVLKEMKANMTYKKEGITCPYEVYHPYFEQFSKKDWIALDEAVSTLEENNNLKPQIEFLDNELKDYKLIKSKANKDKWKGLKEKIKKAKEIYQDVFEKMMR